MLQQRRSHGQPRSIFFLPLPSLLTRFSRHACRRVLQIVRQLLLLLHAEMSLRRQLVIDARYERISSRQSLDVHMRIGLSLLLLHAAGGLALLLSLVACDRAARLLLQVDVVAWGEIGGHEGESGASGLKR